MIESLTLPQPQKDLDFPLMKAIQLRKTKRKWQEAELSEQDLSNLLWVACGEIQQESNNSKSRRTIPSACNSQEIRVYVALQKGLFLYNENQHRLEKILEADIREHIGTQTMMQSAPVGLIYVSDYSRLTNLFFKNDDVRFQTSATDAAFIGQNVYLYCAATNLSTAFLGLVDREKLHSIMQLGEHEKVVYTQVVGRSLTC